MCRPGGKAPSVRFWGHPASSAQRCMCLPTATPEPRRVSWLGHACPGTVSVLRSVASGGPRAGKARFPVGCGEPSAPGADDDLLRPRGPGEDTRRHAHRHPGPEASPPRDLGVGGGQSRGLLLQQAGGPPSQRTATFFRAKRVYRVGQE